MAYVGFDLDETLGRFSAGQYCSFFLQPHTAIYRTIWSGMYDKKTFVKEPALSAELETLLNQTFDKFVDCLVEKERQDPPLGLIRPAMIQIARRLQEMKETGEVKAVVIYSNNGNLSLLHLAGKMIEKLANAPGLFCNYIHWYHPLRRFEVNPARPGMADKTLVVLIQAFQGGTCRNEEDIPIEQIYFFDDSDPAHPDLLWALGNNYFKIAPYKYDADYSVLIECFTKVMNASGLLENEDYKNYLEPVLKNNVTLEGILDLINKDKEKFERKLVKPNNAVLLETTLPRFPKPLSRKNLSKAMQTLRRLEQKQNMGSPLTNQEQQNFNLARSFITQFETRYPNQGGGKKRTHKNKKRRGNQ